MIPQEERMEMLKYQECVDYITLIDDIDGKEKWEYELIKLIKPNLFVTTVDSYSKEQIKDIGEYSNEVLILPRQAEHTSTTEIIERMIKKHLEAMLSKVMKKG